MRIVLDANLIAALVLPLAYSEAVKALVKDWEQSGAHFAGPALWSYEVLSAVRKLIAAGYLPAEKVDTVLEQIWELDIDLIPDNIDLQRRAQAWAARLGQSKSYDGAYLAVAEALGAEFWTADRALVQGAGVDWVRLLEAGV